MVRKGQWPTVISSTDKNNTLREPDILHHLSNLACFYSIATYLLH